MITAVQALFIVRQKIEEIRSAEAKLRDIKMNARAGTEQRWQAQMDYEANTASFRYQWQNVERILQECLKDEFQEGAQ